MTNPEPQAPSGNAYVYREVESLIRRHGLTLSTEDLAKAAILTPHNVMAHSFRWLVESEYRQRQRTAPK